MAAGTDTPIEVEVAGNLARGHVVDYRKGHYQFRL
jgi:hypothetical protein